MFSKDELHIIFAIKFASIRVFYWLWIAPIFKFRVYPRFRTRLIPPCSKNNPILNSLTLKSAQNLLAQKQKSAQISPNGYD